MAGSPSGRDDGIARDRAPPRPPLIVHPGSSWAESYPPVIEQGYQQSKPENAGRGPGVRMKVKAVPIWTGEQSDVLVPTAMWLLRHRVERLDNPERREWYRLMGESYAPLTGGLVIRELSTAMNGSEIPVKQCVNDLRRVESNPATK